MSDWKRSAAARRDARNTKSDPRPATGSSKNTKRWCGGKVGREHQTKCVKYNDVKRSHLAGLENSTSRHWRILICATCGKELATYWPMKFKGWPNAPKPDWVTE
jgi:hypothetical protein